MTLLAFNMIEDTLNEVTAVHQIVRFMDYEDIVVRWVFRTNVVGDLAGAVNSFLVVTTKENIRRVTLGVPISRYLPHA